MFRMFQSKIDHPQGYTRLGWFNQLHMVCGLLPLLRVISPLPLPLLPCAPLPSPHRGSEEDRAGDDETERGGRAVQLSLQPGALLPAQNLAKRRVLQAQNIDTFPSEETQAHAKKKKTLCTGNLEESLSPLRVR